MTKVEKIKACSDLEFLIKFKVSQKTLDLWLYQVCKVFATYWPRANTPGYIMALYFRVAKDKGKQCLVARKDGMSMRHKEASAKQILRTYKSQLLAEIGLM